MRSTRHLTFALVRDPRLPHLLRSLLADVWEATPGLRRRLVVATCFEDLSVLRPEDEVEAVLVEIRDGRDVMRLAGARDAAPEARVIAIPSSLLLTPLAGTDAGAVELLGAQTPVLEALDVDSLRSALALEPLDRAV